MVKRKLKVFKFGGTSLGDPKNPKSLKRLRKVAAYLARLYRKGERFAVVVSAQGKTTEGLVEMARYAAGRGGPDMKELDKLLVTGEAVSAALLAMALQRLGISTTSLDAHEMGIEGVGKAGKGKIKSVSKANSMRRRILAGEVLVITGFQAVGEEASLLTLDFGGSDTSAVVIATELDAEECVIFTDVKGVYTVDPEIVPTARIISFAPYRFMQDMAVSGAGVVMWRAIAAAEEHGVRVRVRKSPSLPGKGGPGTLIAASNPEATQLEGDGGNCVGLAIQQDLAAITVSGLPNRKGEFRRVFASLPEGLVVGDEAQSIGARWASVSFTVKSDDCSRAVKALRAHGYSPRGTRHAAGLTLVDPAMVAGSGYLRKIGEALDESGVSIAMSSSAAGGILVVVRASDLSKAAQALAEEFELVDK